MKMNDNLDLSLNFYTLPWAVVGIINGAALTVESMRRSAGELPAQIVERYVLGYLRFWGLSLTGEKKLTPCTDAQLQRQGRTLISQYVRQNPPARPLPRFYLVLTGQYQFAECSGGVSPVYCL